MLAAFLSRFEEAATSWPDARAVTDAQESISYSELSRRAIGWSVQLAQQGVHRNDVVALAAARTSTSIAVILGAWRLGAACMPYAPGMPAPRLRQMFDQVRPAVAVAGSAPPGWPSDRPLLPPAGDTAASAPAVLESQTGDLTGDGLAYILFTSGSTGVPKAVAMPHSAIDGLIDWQMCQDEGPRTTTQFAPLFFDVAFQELMSTLGAGGELVMVPEEARREPTQLIALVDAAGVDRMFLPTAALAPFCQAAAGLQLPGLRDVIVAGEQLKITDLVRGFFDTNPHVRLHNHYGPCETHVVTTHTMSGPASAWPALPPIGRPLPHVRITVTGQEGEPVAPGELGELLVHGACVASGYYRDPEGTQERFCVDASGTTTYRTGDLVREEADGLRFYGRRDQQVKVRGYRVEVEEVEVVLDGHPELARSAVRPIEVSGTTVLAAYVETVSTAVPPSNPVRRFEPEWASYVAARLPDYMVPSVWVEIDRIPLTQTGKVDRLALPAAPTSRPDLNASFAIPRSATERRVAKVWQEVLGVDAVGLDDPFFDLGGSSLLAAQVVAGLQEEFGLSLATRKAYQHPTVRTLAGFIDGETTTAPPTTSGQARTVPPDEAVAVVGIGCRFPGASTPAEFWANLVAGVESIWRPDVETIDRRNAADPWNGAVVRAAGLLNDIDQFDARFFGLRPREAALIDPQHRLFLECCVEALDDAGIAGPSDGRVGVFAGCGPSSYLLNNVLPSLPARPRRNLIDSVDELELLMATTQDFIASRAAYLLNCTGPTVNVNAACATSLVALHHARVALLRGECDLALAGAAAISVPQVEGYIYEPAMMYSPDGRCRPYDKAAQGTVFSSGVGVVALKRLSDARADGDLVYAVLAGSAIGNDGAAKVGMTAPSVAGQASVIAAAWADSGLDPGSVGFVEGHGTATPVGDDVELTALAQVFGALPAGSAVLGSVKSNIGHLGWAAGMAGLIKTVLAVSHGQIPPTVHFQHPTDQLTESAYPFRVSGDLVTWSDAERVAGVSAFGLGGVNAHVVVTGPVPVRNQADLARRDGHNVATVVPVSARSRDSLRATVAGYKTVFNAADLDVPAVASTAATGRRHFEWRTAFVGDSAAEFERSRAAAVIPTAPASPGNIVGVFTGQGGEYPGMGRRLAEVSPVYRSALHDLAPLFRELTGRKLDDAIGRLGEPRDPAVSGSIALIQPLVFVTQMAMVELWRSLGVEFDVVMGHSLGEFAAACTAGVFPVEDGLRFVAERGRLLQSLPDDAGMAVLYRNEDDTRELVADSRLPLEISALNAPLVTGVSGKRTVLEEFVAWACAKGLDARILTVNRAGHSSLMDPILYELHAAARSVRFGTADRPMISNVTGELAGSEVGSADYWREHLRQPVRFAAGLLRTASIGAGSYVEIGGHTVLSPLIAACRPDFEGPVVPTLRRGQRDDRVLAESVASLYTAGASVNWSALPGATARRTRLPAYPFTRSRTWVDSPVAAVPTSATRDGALSPRDTSSEHWQYEISWRPTDLPQPDGPKRWLLVHDDPLIADALIDRLVGAGHRVMQTRKLDKAQMSDVDEVVVCATGSTGATDPISAVCAPLSALLTAAASDTGKRVTVLTRLAQPAPDGQVTQWPLAALIGTVRVARNELGTDDFRSIDIESATDLARLAAALSAPGGGEFADRGGSWYQPVLTLAEDADGSPAPLSPEKTFLVVGGLRGLGLWSAEQLIRAGARQLVLVGRTAPTGEERARLAALRSAGATVDVHQVDITDKAAVAALVSGLPHIGLGGVLYCAGVLHDGVLTESTWERFEPSLRAKAVGAALLADEIEAADLHPEFFVLYSSAASILGHPGQAAHAAANAMLDAFAHFQRQLGRPMTAVNWGPWRDDGFLRDKPALLALLDQSGMRMITAGNGARLLRRVLRSAAPQVAFLANDWPVYLRHYGLSSDPFYRSVAPSSTEQTVEGDDLCREIAIAPESRRREIVRRAINEAVEAVLGETGDGPFHDLGMDSLSAIRLRNALASRLTCTLPLSVAFDHPSADLLTEHLTASVLDDAWRAKHSGASGNRVLSSQASEPAVYQVRGEDVVRPWSMQQRRWLELIEGSGYGHRVVPIVFHAPFVREPLLSALHDVIGRHELLRYRYTDDGSMLLPPRACLPDLDILVSDVSVCPEDERQRRVAALVDELRTNVPNLRTGPSWTLRCVRTEADEFVILLSLQHIDFDGTGLTVFAEELRDAYHARRIGVPADLPAAVGYAEFVAWQRAAAEEQRVSALEFFRGLFASVPVTTSLPNHHGFGVTRALPSERYTPDLDLRSELLRQAAARLRVSPFALVLGTYATTVYELVGASSVVISAIASGRSEERFLRTIGPFTAPLPMPLHPAGCDPNQMAVQANAVSTAVNGRAPLMPITELLEDVRCFDGFPFDTYFSDVAINFTNYGQVTQAAAPFEVEVLEVLGPVRNHLFAQVDFGRLTRVPGLHLVFDASGHHCRPNFWFHTDRFSPAWVENVAHRFCDLLTAHVQALLSPALPQSPPT
ncbi:SDR family NAD(P)-dependent oxidoreductase [Dactylosporangium sp. NPDC051485]|uniref:SDR family NAD(P)-dependent oxidoreductase n=1 Tax=Dactylosporangium sp. NPDC051485 TaxID=3154846 RepID=UPI003434E895